MTAYSFKKQFVEPIRVGLGLPPTVEAFAASLDAFGNVSRPQPKRQTIRAVGRRRHALPGETLQLYTAMRTKQCQKIGDATCVYVAAIKIDVLKTKLKFSDFVVDPEAFARADGFAGAADMHAFWLKEHGPGKFEGVLIRWEPK